MEKKEDSIINNLVTETNETKPEDGFVQQTKVRTSLNYKDHITYKKGYSKTHIINTNDPRITRPFVYGICTLFFIIGIISLLSKSWFFGIIFTSMSILGFLKSKKDIDAISIELKKQGKDVTIDSKEEAKELVNDFSKIVQEKFEDSKKSVFVKSSFKWFFKITLPIYIIISVICSIIGFIINIILGIVITFITIAIGIFFYYIINKICKY